MKSLIIVVVAFVIRVLEVTVSSQNVSSKSVGKSEHRIVGGYPISIKEAPWTVQLIYKDYLICGGSIVSTTKILTAAHCMLQPDQKRYTIRAGTAKSNLGGQVRKVTKFMNHPRYVNSRFVVNDISILSLQKPLKLSLKVAIIGVDDKSSVLPEGIEAFATGWGKLCERCDVSRTLQAVKVPVIANDRCEKMYKKFDDSFTISPSLLCCGLEVGGKDTCQGDSGGPVMYNNTLVGIVSFGIGCARPNLPGVYTRVSYFASWLKSYV